MRKVVALACFGSLVVIPGQIAAQCNGSVTASTSSSGHYDCSRPSGAPAVDCIVRVVRGGEPVLGFQVSVTSDGRSFAGSKTDSTGRATVRVIPGARHAVYLEDRDAVDGFRVMRLAPVGKERAPDFCHQEETIELPDTLVRVRVTDAANGALVPGAAVGAKPADVPYREWVRRADRGVVALKSGTGDDGEVEIPGLPPGRLRIRANKSDSSHNRTPGRAWKGDRTIDLREGESVFVDLAVEETKVTVVPYDQRDEEERLRMNFQAYRRSGAVDLEDSVIELALEEANPNFGNTYYVTEERFGRVVQGMTQEEVVAAIGLVALNQIRYYVGGQVLGWLYPREKEGGWAAVYFEREDGGDYAVCGTAVGTGPPPLRLTPENP